MQELLPDAHEDRHPEGDAIPEPESYAVEHADGDTYRHTLTYPHRILDADALADAFEHADFDAHRYGDADQYADSNRDAHGDPDEYRDA